MERYFESEAGWTSTGEVPPDLIAARERYEQVLNLDSMSFPALVGLAKTHMLGGDAKAGVAALTRAVLTTTLATRATRRPSAESSNTSRTRPDLWGAGASNRPGLPDPLTPKSGFIPFFRGPIDGIRVFPNTVPCTT